METDFADGDRASDRGDGVDREMDRFVYKLYGLSEEEIALVEGATA